MAQGQRHACALSSSGRAQCWGINEFGQLGNGNKTTASAPVNVDQGAVDYIAIGNGTYHSCALSSSGQAYCWGYGNSGRLGNGSVSDQLTPVAVTQSGITFASISVGSTHNCGMTSGGQAYCWGDDAGYGKMGNGLLSDQTTPVAVTQGGVTFASISAGASHTCASTSGGQAYCWGYGGNGRLGNGSTSDQATPVAVTQTSFTLSSIFAGASHTCGLTNGGQAYCWGYGFGGRLGNNSTATQNTPVPVTQGGGLTFASIAVGGSHTCGLDGAGKGYCWGANMYGQLGDGTVASRLIPTAINPGSIVFSSIATTGANSNSMCAAEAATQKVWCWGQRSGGRLGDGKTLGQAGTPTLVSQTGINFVSTSTGLQQSCGLASGGQAYCWGYGGQGRLGTGSVNDQTTPTAVVQGGASYTSLSTGYSHTCAVASGGQAYCWGDNNNGRLGNGSTTDSTTPVAVTQGGVTFASIRVGYYHSCALTSGGQAYCWGYGLNGRLGNGGTGDQTTPVAVTQGGTVFASLSVGSSHSCGLTSGGQTYCWGSGANGRLGTGGTADQTTPAAVTQGGPTYASISSGGSHTCALTSSGQSYCWGNAASGRLGDGSTSGTVSAPVAVTQGGLTFALVTSGYAGTCALTSAGVAYCWGSNTNGQVGDGATITQRTTPVEVAGGRNFTSINLSPIGTHACALISGGQAYCWGYDDWAQLGTGIVNQLSPGLTWYLVNSDGASVTFGVRPIMTFGLSGRSTACNSSSTPTSTATATALDLGRLTSVAPVIGAQDFTISTNAGSGFSVALKFSGPLTSASGATIANASGSAGTPAAFPAGAGFGYTTDASVGFAGPLWAGPTTSFATILSTAAPADALIKCVAYQAAASGTTPPGAYSGTVVYLATPTF